MTALKLNETGVPGGGRKEKEKEKEKSPGPTTTTTTATTKPIRKRYSITIDTGTKHLKSNKSGLWQPDLNDLAESITKALQSNFESVTVTVTSSPNLQEWCGLAERGLSGNCRLADVGGVPFMMNPQYHHITYQLPDIVRACDMHGTTLVIGSGAASPTVVGKNAELMVNTLIPGPAHNRFAKVDQPDKVDDNDYESDHHSNESEDELSVSETNRQMVDREPKPHAHAYPKHGTPTKGPNSPESNDMGDLKLEHENIGSPTTPTKTKLKGKKKKEKKFTDMNNDGTLVPVVGSYPSEETGCLMNLFMCDGKPGKVIYIKVKKRKGELNFTHTIREGMKNCKGVGKEQQIGMGGVFKVNSGKIKGHIMPDFNRKKMDENNQEEVNKWLRFYEFGPHLLMLSCLVTDDPTSNKNMHLRLEHTHFYSLDKNAHEGGHYHYDTTPDEIEYEGYFSLAEKIYRVEDAYEHVANDQSLNKVRTP